MHDDIQDVYSIVRQAEQNFRFGNTKIGKYTSWSMHETIETIDAYLNSQHISGKSDSLGRDKPFFNIVVAASNIWFRATEIKRADIRFLPQSSKSYVLAFIANVLLQRWMDQTNFDKFLNDWGRILSRYGSAVVKFVEKGNELNASVIPWNRVIPDSIQWDALPTIEKIFKTIGQLKNMATPGHPDYAGYDMDTVDALENAIAIRRTLDQQQQDLMPYFVELYEVHGLMDSRLLKDEDLLDATDLEPSQIDYVEQMHVISYVQQEDGEGYDDFCLFKGKERKNPNKITHLIEEDGRTLAIGAVEYLFDSQWMANHSMKNVKDTLDLASRLMFQTADTQFTGRNVLSAMETGDVLIHSVNMPLTRIANDKPDISASEQFLSMWSGNAKELSGTPDAMRGTNMGSSRASYRMAAFLSQQANTLFNLMAKNKCIHLEEIFKDFVIPHLKKQLKHTDEIVAILDDQGIKQIDMMYVPQEAIKRFNDRTLEQMSQNIQQMQTGAVPSPLSPFNPAQEQQGVQSDQAQLGNKRFLIPSEIDKQTWAELLSDFEWDSLKVEGTTDQQDKQAILQTLSTTLQTIAANPAILNDPNAKMLFNRILTESGVVSPLEIAMSSPAVVPNAATPYPTTPQASPPTVL